MLAVVVTGDNEESELRGCNVKSINACMPSITYNIPPTRICCFELKQNVDCFSDYRQVYPDLGYVYAACYIKFNELYSYDM